MIRWNAIYPSSDWNSLLVRVVALRKASQFKEPIFVFVLEVLLNLRNNFDIDPLWCQGPNSYHSFRFQNSPKSDELRSADHQRGSEEVNKQTCNEFIDKEQKPINLSEQKQFLRSNNQSLYDERFSFEDLDGDGRSEKPLNRHRSCSLKNRRSINNSLSFPVAI
jgi:hypothetical protein